MGRTMERIILLLCVIIYLIGSICALECPRFEKHEALRRGLLNKRAICRAAKYGLEEKICLNGLMSEGFYCATGTCNIFGSMCNGHCFTGDDNTDTEHDFNVNCEETIYHEQVKLCDYYRDQLEKHKQYMKITYNPLDFDIIQGSTVGIAVKQLYDLHVSQSLEENVQLVCPVMGWAVSEALIAEKHN